MNSRRRIDHPPLGAEMSAR